MALTSFDSGRGSGSGSGVFGMAGSAGVRVATVDGTGAGAGTGVAAGAGTVAGFGGGTAACAGAAVGVAVAGVTDVIGAGCMVDTVARGVGAFSTGVTACGEGGGEDCGTAANGAIAGPAPVEA